MVCLSRPYPFRFFKGFLPQILLGLLLNTFSQIYIMSSLCTLKIYKLEKIALFFSLASKLTHRKSLGIVFVIFCHICNRFLRKLSTIQRKQILSKVFWIQYQAFLETFLAHFMAPQFLSIPPEKVRNPQVFWYFQGV